MAEAKGFRQRVRVEFLPSCLGKEITLSFKRDGRWPAFSKTLKVTGTVKVGLRTKDPDVRRRRKLEAELCLENELRFLSEHVAGVEQETILTLAKHFYDDYLFQNEERFEDVHSPMATTTYSRQRALWRLPFGDVGIKSFDTLHKAVKDPAERENLVTSFFRPYSDEDNSPGALEGQFGMLISAYGPNDDIQEQDRYRILIEIRQQMRNAARSNRISPPEFFLDPALDRHSRTMLDEHAANVRRYERLSGQSGSKSLKLPSAEHVSWSRLLELWQAERPVSDGSVFIYKRAIAVATELIGHDNAACLRKKDFFDWRKKILEYPTIGRRTAKQNHLKALNRLLNIGVHHELIEANYLKAIAIHLDNNPDQGEKEYTEEEIISIVKIATKSLDPAYRWIPLILATSGARCKELTSLWHDQIKMIKGIYCFCIHETRDGIKPKNPSSYRNVPIHQRVLDEGLLDFANSRIDKPLFYNVPQAYGKYHPSGVLVTKIGAYVKKIRPTECDKPPCHGFRHSIISTLRRIESDVEKRAYIVGHKRQGESDTYGSQWYEGLKQTIDKFPTYGL